MYGSLQLVHIFEGSSPLLVAERVLSLEGAVNLFFIFGISSLEDDSIVVFYFVLILIIFSLAN